jgi:DNA-directed RNA polymerase subunit M/transcription elongation factor TFIIS
MAAVLCPSCGQAVSVADDYNRRKIRCPDCGVYCDVPVSKERKTEAKVAAKKAPDSNAAPDPWIDNILFKEDPLPTCSSCGKQLTPAENRSGSGGQCGRCKAQSEKRAKPEQAPATQTVKKPHPKRIISTQDDDGTPYQFAERLGATCPECEEEVGKTATSCSNCGHTWQVEQPPPREFAPVDLEWESGKPYHKRVRLLIYAQGFGLLMGIGSAATFNLGFFIPTWTLTTAMLCFLLGTYARVNLTRNKKGRVALSKTWRAFFRERPSEVVDLKQYVGVATGKAFDGGLVNWIFFFVFLGMGGGTGTGLGLAAANAFSDGLVSVIFFLVSLGLGLLPALIWFYISLHRECHYVALTQEHGYKAYTLYHGWDGDQAEEIATAIQEIAGLPLEKP